MTRTGRPVTRAALAKRLQHLPSGLVATGALLIVAVIAGAILSGWPGAIGGAAGVVLVAVSYVVSSIVIAWSDIYDPKLIMPVGLMLYAVKFTALGVIMWAIARTGWAGTVPMGIGVGAAAVVWTAAQSWWTYHAKILYADPSDLD